LRTVTPYDESKTESYTKQENKSKEAAGGGDESLGAGLAMLSVMGALGREGREVTRKDGGGTL